MAALHHRWGGTISNITAVGHVSYKGVATWYVRGDIKWRDGGESEQVAIEPNMLCHDGTAEGIGLVDAYLGILNDYLAEVGEWHKTKRVRGGRMVNWTPKQPKGERQLSPLTA